MALLLERFCTVSNSRCLRGSLTSFALHEETYVFGVTLDSAFCPSYYFEKEVSVCVLFIRFFHGFDKLTQTHLRLRFLLIQIKL
jgi:hypothetical protein